MSQDELYARVLELEKGIRRVVTQRADDLCWADVYVYLGHLVGLPTTPEDLALLPVDVTDRRCQQYFRSLREGCPYDTDYATKKIRALEIENEALRRDLLAAADRVSAQSEIMSRSSETGRKSMSYEVEDIPDLIASGAVLVWAEDLAYWRMAILPAGCRLVVLIMAWPSYRDRLESGDCED